MRRVCTQAERRVLQRAAEAEPVRAAYCGAGVDLPLGYYRKHPEQLKTMSRPALIALARRLLEG